MRVLFLLGSSHCGPAFSLRGRNPRPAGRRDHAPFPGNLPIRSGRQPGFGGEHQSKGFLKGVDLLLNFPNPFLRSEPCQLFHVDVHPAMIALRHRRRAERDDKGMKWIETWSLFAEKSEK